MDQVINVIGGYGALGACLLYFMYKDIERSKCEREDKAKSAEQFERIVSDFRDILQEIRDMLLVKGAA